MIDSLRAIGSATQRALAWPCALALALAGCLDHELPPGQDGDGGVPRVFIAVPRDFRDFQDWEAIEVAGMMHASVQGPLVAYVNRMPEPDADEFPVGTIIVKTVEAGAPSQWTIHGMAKRGGQFNTQGAYDWEFFELGFSANDVPIILWRGEKPPDGEGYQILQPGMTMAADCNGCHVSSKNDAVLSPELDLDAPR